VPAPVPGLEARHSWSNGPGVVINNHEVWPRLKLKRLTGFGMGDSDDNREPLIGRHGEITYDSFLRGHTIVYEGEYFGQTLSEMRNLEATLRACFLPRQEGQMTITYHPSYAVQQTRFFLGRCIQLELPDEQGSGRKQPTPFARTFIIGIRLSDPRVYASPAVSGETEPITGSSGGATPPITPPITLSLATASGLLAISNPGGFASDPTITLHGPVTNPVIEHQELGVQLEFHRDFVLASGATCVIDFKARTILEGGQDRRRYLKVPTSTWWDKGVDGIISGTNTIQISGSAISNPAKAVVEFFPAD
jgi:hypothetical protein